MCLCTTHDYTTDKGLPGLNNSGLQVVANTHNMSDARTLPKPGSCAAGQRHAMPSRGTSQQGATGVLSQQHAQALHSMHSMVSLPSIQPVSPGGLCAARQTHGQTPAQHAQHHQASWSPAAQQAQHAQHMQPTAWSQATQQQQQRQGWQPQHTQQTAAEAQPLVYGQYMQQGPLVQPIHDAQQTEHAQRWPTASASTQSPAQLSATSDQGFSQQVDYMPASSMQQGAPAATSWVQHSWFPALHGGYQPWRRAEPVHDAWQEQRRVQHQQLQHQQPDSLLQQAPRWHLQHDVLQEASQNAATASDSYVHKSLSMLSPVQLVADGACQPSKGPRQTNLFKPGSDQAQIAGALPPQAQACSSKIPLRQERSTKHQQHGLLQQQPGLIRTYNLNALLT